MKSISEFIKEVYEDIDEITKSPDLTAATIINTQSGRIKLKGIFYNFLYRIEQDCLSLNFNPQGIADNYIVCTNALSSYIVCQVLENIISGNIDSESMKKLELKITKAYQPEFPNDVTMIGAQCQRHS